MARAGGPVDDKRNAAVDHVNKNFPQDQGNWYVPGASGKPQGRPSTYEDVVNLTQACLLLGTTPTGEVSSAALVEIAKRISDLTDRIAALEVKP